MTTMAQAVKTFVESAGRPVTSDEIKQVINSEYPDQWKSSTLQAHLYACVVNNPKAYIHHPSAQRFLYKNSDGTFELYEESRHGPNEWAPDISDDETSDVGELIDTSVSLERDIEDHLVKHLDSIEAGLKFVGRQESTDVGRIDILAEDRSGTAVIIEVKVGEAKDSAIGQIARYLGWFGKSRNQAVRGMLIASEFPDGVRYAAAAIPNLELIAYRVHFTFENISIAR